MTYVIQTWVDKDASRPLSAERMNHIEAGVFAADVTLNVKEAPYNAKGNGVADDTTAIQSALTAAAPPGEEVAVVIPPGSYLVSSSLKVPENVTLLGLNRRNCRIITKSNINILSVTGTGDVEIGNLWIEAETKQTGPSGTASGIDFSHGFSANAWVHDITLGDNLYNGIYLVGESSLIGGIHFRGIHYTSSAHAVKGYGNAGMLVGSTTCRVAGVWINDLHGQANENKDMPIWIQINNTDSLLADDVGLQNSKEGIVIGNSDKTVAEGGLQTTGLKLVNCWVDSQSEGGTFTTLGYKLQKAIDATFTNCNAQNCAEGWYIGAECVQVKVSGGTAQSNRNHGMRIASTVVSVTVCGGFTSSDNNAAGSAVAGEGAGIAIEAGASNIFITGCALGNFLAQGAKQQYGIFIAVGAGENIFVSGNVLPEKGTKPAGGPIRESTVKAVVNGATGTKVLIGATPVNAYS